MSEPLPVVHVVGLGPGGADLLSVGTVDLLQVDRPRFLRTRRHPAASAVPDAESFDDVYDRSERIEQVYATIVEELVAAAVRAASGGGAGEVLYAVPGSPVVAEHTVELLVADPRVDAVLHPALSFLDLTWVRLGIDPVELGVRLVDGHRFAVEAAGERGPMLVGQCDSTFVLSDIKLAFEDPPGVPVVLLQRLGLPDEVVVEVDWSEIDRTIEPDHLTSLWIPRLDEPASGEIRRLDELMRRLRAEDPWKAEQTHRSLQRYLLEESYEVLEAIDAYDPDTGDGADELCSELGDLLYQVVFHSTIAAEAGWFSLADVAAAIHDKLVRRHPHVFDDALEPGVAPEPGAAPEPAAAASRAAMPSVDALVRAWEDDKRRELGRASVYDGIPAELPALARAAKVARKADPTPAPPDPTPAPPDPPDGRSLDDAALGEALWDLVLRAHAAGLDPEDALRRQVDIRLRQLRAHEG
ncbi:MAG: MazG nucleotide pyrophosphohydrolase domain-containing protein [Microthrixaceae bacterium]